MPFPPSLIRKFTLAAAAAASLAGCAAHQLNLSKSETDAILDDLSAQMARQRQEAADSSAGKVRTPREKPEVPEVMTLDGAIRIAHSFNRQLEGDRESLVLAALSLRGARNDIGPRMSGSVRSVLRDGDDREGLRTDEGELSLTGLLPSGADVRLGGSASRVHGVDDIADTSADGSLTARISQPLLRGAGPTSAYEALTDAQRQALYDVRQFELSRQDLSLRVQRDFYGIVSQKRVVENSEQSLAQFEFLKRRSETLFAVDRVSEVDKFRATREYLSAKNALVDARQDLEGRIDRFKVLLGIEENVEFAVADDIPEVRQPGEIDLKMFVEMALANRLELMTAREQVEDAERRVRIRSQDLLPRLDLVAEGTRATTGPDRHLSSMGFDDDSYLLSVELELPLDRVRERGALRRARVNLARSRRGLSQAEDDVILDVREAVRSYRSALNSLAIQKQIVASEEKNTKVARLRFENGEISNRDLTDAQNNMTNARNRLIRERVRLENTKADFLRAVGLLRLEEDGTWRTDILEQLARS